MNSQIQNDTETKEQHSDELLIVLDELLIKLTVPMQILLVIYLRNFDYTLANHVLNLPILELTGGHTKIRIQNEVYVPSAEIHSENFRQLYRAYDLRPKTQIKRSMSVRLFSENEIYFIFQKIVKQDTPHEIHSKILEVAEKSLTRLFYYVVEEIVEQTVEKGIQSVICPKNSIHSRNMSFHYLKDLAILDNYNLVLVRLLFDKLKTLRHIKFLEQWRGGNQLENTKQEQTDQVYFGNFILLKCSCNYTF